jgi:NADH-quinone oxidoreductase subunit N
MKQLLIATTPELILLVTACALFLLGIARGAGARKVAAWVALAALVVVFIYQAMRMDHVSTDATGAVHVARFANYIKMLAAGVGALLVLLAWPTNRDATGNSAMDVGVDACEILGLMLTSIAGVFLVAGANDIILLFLAIELASIPTYIMVSISRPVPAAQEAGVKYFFLGAMSAALMLFGFSYLYGTTGLIKIDQIAAAMAPAVGQSGQTVLNHWQQLAVLMLVAGFSFKMAAVPLHFYAGDVYQGAATPVTAFLSFVPKTSGVIAMIKLLMMATGGHWYGSPMLIKLLWIIAVLTMSVGNVLGLLQFNIKRVFAYSSIAHSGYMLVGLTAMVGASDTQTQSSALEGVLFYLAAYGLMNAAAFGVLMLLPAREDGYRIGGSSAGVTAATSAETFEDLAGQGRRHPALGLAMAVSCFSLIGLPLTVGFLGKFYLLRPAFEAHMYWLVIATVINAAISAGYYLRIVGTMFLRAEPEAQAGSAVRPVARAAMPIVVAVALSAGGTLLFGTILPATKVLTNQTIEAADVQTMTPAAQTAVVQGEPR